MDVTVRLRGCQNNHRDAAQCSVGFDFGQYFPPVLPGKVQVEQDEIGAFGLGVGAAAAQALQRLYAVDDVRKLTARAGLPERFHHQSRVSKVVFHQQNVDGAFVHETGPCLKARYEKVRIPPAGFNPKVPGANERLSPLAAVSGRSYVRGMKRNYLLAGLLANILCLPLSSPAQDAQESPAAAAAERENIEANFKQVNVKMELLEEALRTQQKRTSTLVEEIHTLRQEVDRLKSRNESAATQESIKRLADKIEEVDKKRQDDNELVLSKLKEIMKGLSKPTPVKEPSASPSNPKRENPAPPPADKRQENVYEYKIKDGDYLVRIVKDLNAQGFKVTQKQIMDANPKVNWKNLAIGSSIFIPQPAP